MGKIQKICDAVVVIGLIVIVGYWIYGALAPAKFSYTQHTVSSGDTLYEIAQHYGKESKESDLRQIIWDIQKINNISHKEVGYLKPGRVLTIPIRK